jgi:hypothetical protein
MQCLAVGGPRSKQIDHFDPRRKKDLIQKYTNLFLASAHCNGAKSDTWPTTQEEKKGIRFLNCCRERDYGAVIFEDPTTHMLEGTTPAARWHIEMLDLNADHLITERADRARLRKLLTEKSLMPRPGFDTEQLSACIEALRKLVESMIPPIPSRPAQTDKTCLPKKHSPA